MSTDSIVKRRARHPSLWEDVALDDLTLDIPAGCMAGMIGPDGVGKSTLLALISGVRKIQSGTVTVLDGDMADEQPSAGELRPHRLHAAGAWAAISTRRSAFATTSISSAALFGQGAAERRARIDELLKATGLDPFPGSPVRQALGRHEAEGQPLLLADARSRSACPRRADHRRRSALAPPVLGADRLHPRRRPQHERDRGDRLHGRGEPLRLACRDGRRQGHRAGRAQRNPRQSGQDQPRRCLHRLLPEEKRPRTKKSSFGRAREPRRDARDRGGGADAPVRRLRRGRPRKLQDRSAARSSASSARTAAARRQP